MNWINKHFQKIAIIIVILAIVWVVFGPWLVTRITFLPSFANTGQIGDTIGGITAPVVSLISVLLLYLALIKQNESLGKQIESNKNAVHETNFKFIYEEIGHLKKSADNYEFGNYSGVQAINTFVVRTGLDDIAGNLNDEYYSTLQNFDLLLNKFSKIFYLYDSLETSIKYRDILSNELHSVFDLYFMMAYNLMEARWQLESIDKMGNKIKGKMVLIKSHLENIMRDVLKRMPNVTSE